MHDRKRMSGFSLIEALIAFLIVGVGLLGAAKLQAVFTGDSAASQQRDEAVVVAQDAIERFRGFSALATTSGVVAYDDIVSSTAAETVDGTNARYNRSWTVQECCIEQTALTSACPASNCGSNPMRWKNVAVVVNWTDKGGVSNSVNLVTKIARLPPTSDGSLLAAATDTASTGDTGSGTTDPLDDTSGSGSEPPLDGGNTTPTDPTTVTPVATSCSKSLQLDPVDRQYAYASCTVVAGAGSCGCSTTASAVTGNNAIYTCSATITNSSMTVSYTFTRKNQANIVRTLSLSCP